MKHSVISLTGARSFADGLTLQSPPRRPGRNGAGVPRSLLRVGARHVETITGRAARRGGRGTGRDRARHHGAGAGPQPSAGRDRHRAPSVLEARSTPTGPSSTPNAPTWPRPYGRSTTADPGIVADRPAFDLAVDAADSMLAGSYPSVSELIETALSLRRELAELAAWPNSEESDQLPAIRDVVRPDARTRARARALAMVSAARPGWRASASSRSPAASARRGSGSCSPTSEPT